MAWNRIIITSQILLTVLGFYVYHTWWCKTNDDDNSDATTSPIPPGASTIHQGTSHLHPMDAGIKKEMNFTHETLYKQFCPHYMKAIH